ncbi:hypothetical protein AAFF_G00048340 [Aldrovandia affinis]|uniref:Uncharacterized protein n=1 Tax=Aldrovandia affinis TaxID=143900 RepID=A0AAD7S3V2_9TELE|nr:hypothetical protein AAFF_G00048340 [Aldrovandia affinis]
MACQPAPNVRPAHRYVSERSGRSPSPQTRRSSLNTDITGTRTYSPLESTSPSLLAPDNTLERSFFIRMKSTLTKRGVHIKSSGYKVHSNTAPTPDPPRPLLFAQFPQPSVRRSKRVGS